MNVLITGGAGFLGRRLARALLDRGALIGAGNRPKRIDRLALLDVVPADGFSDPRVQVVAGDPATTRSCAARSVRTPRPCSTSRRW